jgi:5'-3' exonuclease
MANIGPHAQNNIFNEDMLRHMILNSLRSYRQKFCHEYGEFIIACDGHNYWRKEFFPFYKANRKKFFEESNLDWKIIFESFKKIKEELKEYFPYKVLEVEKAEADDIIGTLVLEFGWNKMAYMQDGMRGCRILILSGDHDFIQLQEYSNVKQYDPIKKKWIDNDNPDKYLLEHIMKGDAGDGIPSILCEDDYYVDNNHKIKRLTQKKINDLMSKNKNEWPTNIQRNFDRNSSIISLLGENIPKEIRNMIVNRYNTYSENNRCKLMSYFMTYKLKNLLEGIGDF